MRNSSKLKYLFVNTVFSTTTSFHICTVCTIVTILLLLLRSNDQYISSLSPLVYSFKSFNSIWMSLLLITLKITWLLSCISNLTPPIHIFPWKGFFLRAFHPSESSSTPGISNSFCGESMEISAATHFAKNQIKLSCQNMFVRILKNVVFFLKITTKSLWPFQQWSLCSAIFGQIFLQPFSILWVNWYLFTRLLSFANKF